MSWAVVARKDFQDAVRSRALVVLTVLNVLFVGAAVYLFTEVIGAAGGGQDSTTALLSSLSGPVAVFVPLIAVVVSYNALAGERESGSLKLLLSLPHSREDAVTGKLAGRSAVVAVATVVGFLVGAVLVLVFASAFSPLTYVAFLSATLLYAVAYVAIGLGFSAATGSSTKAAVGAFGTFVFFEFLWGLVNDLIVWAVEGSFPFGSGPNWSLFIRQLSPSDAFSKAARVATGRQQQEISQLTVQDGELVRQTRELPFYLQDEAGLIILVLWVVVPLAAAYLLFGRAELS
jgi:ABC-2 type transport system permease protein